MISGANIRIIIGIASWVGLRRKDK